MKTRGRKRTTRASARRNKRVNNQKAWKREEITEGEIIMENTTNNKFIVTGLFKDNRSAECAYDALSERGYGKDDAD